MNRRFTLLQLLATAALPAWGAKAGAANAPESALSQAIARLESRAGGRLGAAVMDEKGVIANHRGNERCALCSTFKLVLAATVLARVDSGTENLERRLDVASDASTVRQLCRAAVVRSDNVAANLLLHTCGGPDGVTRFLRTTGDDITRLDRFEPELSPASRALAIQWLRESATGLARLRAALPASWMTGDKTGTGPDGPTNDIAIAWPPGRPPLLMAVYFERTGYPTEENARVLAAVGAMIGGARFSDSMANPAAAL